MGYNVSDTGPAAYQLQQQQNGQEQTANLLRLLMALKQSQTQQSQWGAEQGLRQQEAAANEKYQTGGLDIRRGEAETSAKREGAYSDYLKSLTVNKDITTKANIASKMKPATEPPMLAEFRIKHGDNRPWEEVSDQEWPVWAKVIESNAKPAPAGRATTGGTGQPKLPPEYTSQKSAIDSAYKSIESKMKENDRNRAILAKTPGNEDQVAVIAARNAKLSQALRLAGKARMQLGGGKPIPQEEWATYAGLGGGDVPQQAAPQVAPPSATPKQGALPPEVADYLKKHPDVSEGDALLLYSKWKKNG